jgi:ribosomal-protein-alanine N-acetyltransferase
MSDDTSIRLARRSDAATIAAMSRDLIELGLGWSWTTGRVVRAIGEAETNVIVAEIGAQRAGFGIMSYRDDDAHLLLLAVQPLYRRHGVGAALVGWLERAALVAGIGQVMLEARSGNVGARAFYRRLGYTEVQHVPGYYRGREASIRLAKDLWLERPTPA